MKGSGFDPKTLRLREEWDRASLGWEPIVVRDACEAQTAGRTRRWHR